ncbi:uncharacterized protein METZ01_LOCUS230158 [marine metagenome]|uniref:Uncharacterized protein n=1 Tax=marine metagenome TaxID=408172 RepID=A0A382GR58_9ZZZZ
MHCDSSETGSAFYHYGSSQAQGSGDCNGGMGRTLIVALLCASFSQTRSNQLTY